MLKVTNKLLAGLIFIWIAVSLLNSFVLITGRSTSTIGTVNFTVIAPDVVPVYMENREPGRPPTVILDRTTGAVTNSKTIEELLSIITPQDIGMNIELTARDIRVRKLNVLTMTTTITANNIKAAREHASDPELLQLIDKIAQSIESESILDVPVVTTMITYGIRSITSGQETYASKLIHYIVAEEAGDITLIVLIPKDMSSQIDNVFFFVEDPKVLQADPVVQWKFSEVSKWDNREIYYYVKKELDSIDTIPLATMPAKKVEPVALPISLRFEKGAQFSTWPIAAIIMIVVGILAGYYLLTQKQKKRKRY